MNESDLNKLHNRILIIADEIDRLCKNNNINYSLISGSLLGAIRHRGFIPWDDDMDIGMLRDDYNKFLEICNTDLNKKFDIQTYETDSNYVYGFAKLLLKGTNLVEYGHENTKYRKGVFVDIFPYDAVPEGKTDRWRQKYKNYILIKMLRQKLGAKDLTSWGIKEKLVFRIIDFIDLFVKKDLLIKKMHSNMIRYNDEESKTIINLSGIYGYNRETMPKSCFDYYMKVPFEDREYYIIKEYHMYLTKIYGEYMKLPPVEDRKTHGFRFIEFGNYD